MAAGRGLTYYMNKLAVKLVNDAPTVSLVSAANTYAGTTGLTLLGALNAKAGNSGLSWRALAGVLNQLAGTTNLSEVDAARVLSGG